MLLSEWKREAMTTEQNQEISSKHEIYFENSQALEEIAQKYCRMVAIKTHLNFLEQMDRTVSASDSVKRWVLKLWMLQSL